VSALVNPQRREVQQLVPIALLGRPLRAENGAVAARRCRSSLVRLGR
jgi:hypothetical protein